LEVLPKKEIQDLAGHAARFFQYAVSGEHDRFKASADTFAAAKHIFSDRKKIENVKVHLFSNGILSDRTIDIQEIHIDGIPIEFSIHDLERIFRLSQTVTSRTDIQIDFEKIIRRPLACLEVTPRPKEYESYLAIFPGELLFDLYEKYGQQLFEFNVRSFLQVTGKVNKGIRETLRNNPDRFMAYNNGLVATADEIEVGQFHGETVIKRIVGLQIVNGAQTTASIHRAKKIDKIDLKPVGVAVKITKVDPEELEKFVPEISRFANTQNNVQISDLSANHSFHIELERISQAVWTPGERSQWFYERARGAYQAAQSSYGTTLAQKKRFKSEFPASQKISKTDLARYLMSWMGRAQSVSLGAQKNFSVFMSELPNLYPANWAPDDDYFRELIAKAILYRVTEKIVRQEKFPAYRSNIVAYLVAYLSHFLKGQLNFEMIWENQSISEELKSVLQTWSGRIDAAIRESAKGRNVTEWCKKDDCWIAISNLRLSIKTARPPEMQMETADVDESASALPTLEKIYVKPVLRDEELLENEDELIEQCTRFDAATWSKISYWGTKTDRLSVVERGVAHTLSQYASAHWIKRPSIKQARRGMRALELAKEAGIVTVDQT
jgi:hypothetical protein